MLRAYFLTLGRPTHFRPSDSFRKHKKQQVFPCLPELLKLNFCAIYQYYL
jgi:hypothetical protein